MLPIPFLYQGDKLIRVVMRIDGAPELIAIDICRELGIKNVSQAVERLEKDESGICETYTSGQKRALLTVTEAGFYTLAFRSNKPSAVAFRRWVTHEVLPSIRRTGAYRVHGARGDRTWTESLKEVRLSVAELRRSYGPQKAARLGVDLWAKVDIIIDDPKPPQSEFRFDQDADDKIVEIVPGARIVEDDAG